MAQITTKQSQMRFPTGAPAVRQPAYMSDYESQAQAQFYGTASKELFGQAGRIGQQAYSQQMTDAGIQTATLLNGLNERIRNDPNPDKYQQYYKETFEQIKGLANNISTGRARLDFLNQINAKSPDWQADINDKIDQRRKININSNATILADNITKIDQRDGKIFNETIENITKTAEGLLSIGLTVEQVNQWTQDRIKDIEKNKVLYTALDLVETGNFDNAQSVIDNSSLQPDDKRQLTYLIRHNMAKKQSAIDKQLQQKETEYLLALGKEQLSQETLDSDLASGIITPGLYKEYSRYVSAQTEERLSGKEVEMDWETYDRLQTLIEDYGEGKVSKEKVRAEISEAVGNTIPVTIAKQLRDRLATKDDPDDPMNKTSAKRAMSMLTELKNADFFWPEDEKDNEVAKRQNHLNYLNLSNELEQWIKATPDVTDEQINDKVRLITEQYINDKVPTWINKQFERWTQSRFGILYRGIAGIEKESKESEITISTRIEVEKNGKRYTIPQEQLPEAEKQGYNRVTK